MLFIESTKPLVLKFPNRKIRLEPGIPIPFEETAALKALAQAGIKIHVVHEPALPMVPPEFREGWFISWRSGNKVLGPIQVLGVDAKAGPLWCLVEVKRTPHWISQIIIVSFIPNMKGGDGLCQRRKKSNKN